MKRRILEGENIYGLSRRDFIKLCGTSSAGVLLAACGYPVATATRSQTPTRPTTPMQIATQSPTTQVTESPTSTLRPSRTPEPSIKFSETPNPSETQTLIYDWVSPTNLETRAKISFDNPLWTGIKNNGAGKVEVFDNPVLGKCLKFTTTVLRHPGDPFRISPEKKIPHLDPSIKANWSLGSEIIFDVGFVPTGDASISIENVFSEIKELGIDYIPMASIDISSSSPSLKAKDPINIGCDWAKYRTTYELKVGIPYYFELKTMGPNIFLYINDELITSGPLHPNLVGVAPVMVKSGAYGYLIKPGKSMYEGNLSFQIFNYISTG